MKKIRLKKWVKYLMLFIIDLIVILNLPNLMKKIVTINDYRQNILILFIILFSNILLICKIEKDL
jgi:hypothetical protein|nr:MAG TPA: hypothetical protein [Caudoviricetes sp.]